MTVAMGSVKVENFGAVWDVDVDDGSATQHTNDARGKENYQLLSAGVALDR